MAHFNKIIRLEKSEYLDHFHTESTEISFLIRVKHILSEYEKKFEEIENNFFRLKKTKAIHLHFFRKIDDFARYLNPDFFVIFR